MRSVCVCSGDRDEVGLLWPAEESVDDLMVSLSNHEVERSGDWAIQ